MHGSGISIYNDAFDKVCFYVSHIIFQDLDVLRMADIRDMYIDLLEEHGVALIEYRTQKLKKNTGTTLCWKVGILAASEDV